MIAKKLILPAILLAGALLAAAGPVFEIHDAVEFNKIISTNAILTTNYVYTSNPPWIEGPVWMPQDGGYLIFSDLGDNKLMKLTPPSTLTNFCIPANTKCNGNTLDRQERLVTCQTAGSALQVMMVNPTNCTVTSLVNQYNGKNFNSPNDLVVKSDGSIWFTDPDYDSGQNNQPGHFVYRFYPTNGNATVIPVVTIMDHPNGLCFSPDEKKLYVCDTGVNPGPEYIRVFNVLSNNTLQLPGTPFATNGVGANDIPDGVRCDVDGRIWSSNGDGVWIYAPDGHLIGKILFAHVVNLCFGGPQYKTLYMVGQPMITSMPVLVPGVPAIKRLSTASATNQLSMAWPAPSTGFALQESAGLGDSATWTNTVQPSTVTNNTNVVTVTTTNAQKFYRLRLN